jgi:hypothetical protein
MTLYSLAPIQNPEVLKGKSFFEKSLPPINEQPTKDSPIANSFEELNTRYLCAQDLHAIEPSRVSLVSSFSPLSNSFQVFSQTHSGTLERSESQNQLSYQSRKQEELKIQKRANFQPEISGQVHRWTKRELQKLVKGFKEGLTAQAIKNKYFSKVEKITPNKITMRFNFLTEEQKRGHL